MPWTPLKGLRNRRATHFRQALLSLILGLGAWAGAVLLFLLVAWSRNRPRTGGRAEPGAIQAAVLLMFGLLALVLVALFGLGQGAAAIRARGNHMILANFGMILSGLYVGVLIGMVGLTIWKLML